MTEPNNLEWLDEFVKEFANRIGSTWGEGATYEPTRPQTAKEEYGDDKPNGNFSHLDDNDWKLFQKDLSLAITSKINEMLEQSRTGWHKEVDGKCLVWNEKEQLWERLCKRKDEVLK